MSTITYEPEILSNSNIVKSGKKSTLGMFEIEKTPKPWTPHTYNNSIRIQNMQLISNNGKSLPTNKSKRQKREQPTPKKEKFSESIYGKRNQSAEKKRL